MHRAILTVLGTLVKLEISNMSSSSLFKWVNEAVLEIGIYRDIQISSRLDH